MVIREKSFDVTQSTPRQVKRSNAEGLLEGRSADKYVKTLPAFQACCLSSDIPIMQSASVNPKLVLCKERVM
jgi:hypothetical protein